MNKTEKKESKGASFMSNRLFQNVIQQMKDSVERVIGVIDENGIVIACSETQRVGETNMQIHEEMNFSTDCMMLNGYTYRYIGSEGKNESIVFVEGIDSDAERLSSVLSITFASMKQLHDKKYDKASFIKNIMLDNILPSDIYVKSKELHFETEQSRVVLIIKFAGRLEAMPIEMIQSIFPDHNHDYIISIGEQDVVLVKEVNEACNMQEIEALAESIVETISTEFYTKVSVGISTLADSLKELARAYKEARIALEVGKVFDTEKNIISYENLGIGRLVYQLPTTLCEIFLQEVFKKDSLESLDRETLMTVQAFFENNLNVSETSRKLFVHRNTLVYRLEKIRKITGLDLREFDHAVTFKVALMVKKYLTNRPTKF